MYIDFNYIHTGGLIPIKQSCPLEGKECMCTGECNKIIDFVKPETFELIWAVAQKTLDNQRRAMEAKQGNYER